MPKSIFKKLKDTLLASGYEVILTKSNDWSRSRLGQHRGIKGYIAPDELKIYVSQTIGINDRVITLIHELLHEISPRWSESRVEATAKRIFQSLSVTQLGFLQFFVITPKENQRLLRHQQLSSPIC